MTYQSLADSEQTDIVRQLERRVIISLSPETLAKVKVVIKMSSILARRCYIFELWMERPPVKEPQAKE